MTQFFKASKLLKDPMNIMPPSGYLTIYVPAITIVAMIYSLHYQGFVTLFFNQLIGPLKPVITIQPKRWIIILTCPS
jgi:hypothetical protein